MSTSVDVLLVASVAAVICAGVSVRTESHVVGPRFLLSGAARWACLVEEDGALVPAVECYDVAVEYGEGVKSDVHYDLDWSAAGAALVFARTVGDAFARAALAAAKDRVAETLRMRA